MEIRSATCRSAFKIEVIAVVVMLTGTQKCICAGLHQDSPSLSEPSTVVVLALVVCLILSETRRPHVQTISITLDLRVLEGLEVNGL